MNLIYNFIASIFILQSEDCKIKIDNNKHYNLLIYLYIIIINEY